MNFTGSKPSAPASSNWRDTLSRRGIDIIRVEDKLKSTKLKESLSLPSCFSFDVLSGTQDRVQYVAHGSSHLSSSQPNKIQIVSVNDAGDHNLVKSFPIDGPANSISWNDDKLIIGSNAGQVFFKPKFDCREKGDVTARKPLMYLHQDISQLEEDAPSPEQWLTNSKISIVNINQRDPLKFLACANDTLYVWNFDQTKTPLTIRATSVPILSASWSPHSRNHILMSGVSKSIKMFDMRNLKQNGMTSEVWKISNAHVSSIRDVKYHPLIPYWLGSASSDGTIKIWDIRYNAKEPILSIEAHDRMIKKIAWSQTHSELLISGGVDRKVKLWNIKQEPHYLVATNTVSDILVGLDFSMNGRMHYHSLCGNGEFISTQISNDFLEPLVNYRFKDPEERDIEKKIYLRDFGNAFDKIILQTETLKKKDLSKALKLLDLCKTKMISSSRVNGGAKQRFRNELKEVTYFIPQNLIVQGVSDKMIKIQNLILNCQILSFVQNGSFSEISNMEKQIIERIEQVADTIDLNTLKEIINLYLNNDYKRGMNLVITIGKIYKKHNMYDKFQDVAKMILSPTTFEVTTNPSLSESAFKQLSKKLEDSDYIFGQIALTRDVLCALWEPESALKIVGMIERKNHSGDEGDIYDILSVSVLRIYLNSILWMGKVIKFFVVANDLLSIMHKNQNQLDFQNIVKEMLTGIGAAKYKDLADSIPKSGLEESVDDKDILSFLEKSKENILATMNISYSCLYIPQAMCDVMFGVLKTFQNDLEYSLKHLISTQNALGYVKDMLNSIEKESKTTLNQINIINNENEKEKEAITKVRQKAESIESILEKFANKN